MSPRHFLLLSFGMLGVAACAVLWLGASGAFGRLPGGTVTWESVFAWIQRGIIYWLHTEGVAR